MSQESFNLQPAGLAPKVGRCTELGDRRRQGAVTGREVQGKEGPVIREQRQHPRLPLPLQIELLHGGRSYRGNLENLSANGALVRLDARVELPPGQRCQLSLDPGPEREGAPPLQLAAETIHGSTSLVGLRFTGESEELHGRLMALVQRLAEEPERPGLELERIRNYLSHFRATLR